MPKDVDLKKPANPYQSYRLPSGPLLFRWSIIGFTSLLLVVQLWHVHTFSAFEFLAFTLTIFCARAVPVALAREKPITFGSAFVFAGSLLLGGAAAGAGAIIAYFGHSRIFQKGGRPYALFLGAQFALAALASQTVFWWMTNRGNLLEKVNGVSPALTSHQLAAICASAAVYIAVNGLLVGLGNLGTRYAQRSYADPVLRAHILSYGVSFPFAVLLVCAYSTFGIAALPILAAALLICAHAVRVTIENRNLRRMMTAMEDLGHSCAAETREEAPLERFLKLASELVTFDHAVLWLEEEGFEELRPRAVYPDTIILPEERNLRLEALLSRAMHRVDPFLATQVIPEEKNGAAAEASTDSGESWILYPLILHGKAIGVAQLSRSARRPFTRQEMTRLTALVPQAAIAFESARVRQLMHQYHEKMHHYLDMAQTDGLTGLYNHRRSQELLRDEMARAARYHHSLTVLMMDVDFFKHYNDTYGHPQGDELLRSISHILQSSVRMTDHVGRYGGEEFVVILPETSSRDGYVLAERIRATVEAAWFAAGEGWVVQKTISIGVAAFPRDADTPEEILQRADAALYRAKHTGKNRVVIAERGYDFVDSATDTVSV